MTELGVVAGARSGRRDGRFLVVPGAIAAAVILLDQVAKRGVATWLGRGEPDHRWELVNGIVAVEYVENSGGAFGLFQGGGAWLAALSAAVVAGLTLYYLRVRRPTVALAASLGLLLGGGIGNLIDRLRLGYVIDFVALGVWPKFNVADTAVTVGVILLAWHVIMEDRVDMDVDRSKGGAR